MFLSHAINHLRNPSRSTSALALVLALLLLAPTAQAASSETLFPVALMNWMVEGTFHALIVDKSDQRLYVWVIKDGEPQMVESYRCATGEKDGDKWVRGDMRTPEGVYFFCSVIDGRRLPQKYGQWAFTTDYPNFVDRRRGKSGDGIWLHGRDKPLGERPDSNGCIALENSDLVKVSRFIRLQSTPLIVVKKMLMEPRSRILEQERELRNFIESWRQSWESQDLEKYMGHYSRNFQSCWLDYQSWKEKKKRLAKTYSKIHVKLGNVYLYRQNGLVTTIFTQAYRSDRFVATGIKVLYLSHEGGYRIYAEDFHQQVDDPNPARTLLARVGGDPGPELDAKPEFRIRLVSTDEPENQDRDDIESPRPVAPSRGVVLERVKPDGSNGLESLPLEMNEKTRRDSTYDRLIQARAVTGEEGYGIEEACRRSEERGREIAKLDPPPASFAERKVEAVAQDPQPPGKVPDEPMIVASVSAAIPVPVQEIKPVDPSGEGLQTGASEEAKPEETKRVKTFLKEWKSAWEKKNLDRFIKMYHPDFQADDLNYDKLRKSKKAFFRKYQKIKVELEQVEIRKVEGRLRVKFRQTFQGDDYRDSGWKNMVLVSGKDEGLRIVGEHWSRIQRSSPDS